MADEVKTPQGPLPYCDCKEGKDNPNYQYNQEKVGMVCLFCNQPRRPEDKQAEAPPHKPVEAPLPTLDNFPLPPPPGQIQAPEPWPRPAPRARPIKEEFAKIEANVIAATALRDVFAMQAMAGLANAHTTKISAAVAAQLAATAYKLADAMLAAREKVPT